MKSANAAIQSARDVPDLLAGQRLQAADSFLVLVQAGLLSPGEFQA